MKPRLLGSRPMRHHRAAARVARLAPDFVALNPGSGSLTRSPDTLLRRPRPGLPRQGWEFHRRRPPEAIKHVEMPDDLGGAVSFLTNDDAAFMAGQTPNLDDWWVRS